ncbi:MAG: hypothetical protein AAFW01_11910 [Pseudomonadota bacterium]
MTGSISGGAAGGDLAGGRPESRETRLKRLRIGAAHPPARPQ